MAIIIQSAPEKDPDSVIDYARDWSPWLASGETITGSEWLINDTLITGYPQTVDGLTADSKNHSTTIAAIWLSGGTLQKRYKLTSRVTTSGGRTEDDSIYVKVLSK